MNIATFSRPSAINTHSGMAKAVPIALPHLMLLALLAMGHSGLAQTLWNVDFGAGAASAKTGFAATGQRTNDVWNLYTHYNPKFSAGMPLVADGKLEKLRLADGTETGVSLSVSNAPGVWGNATGDPMLDSYVFAPNGSNIVVTLTGLDAGRYHFHVFGWAAADVGAEQNPAFSLLTGNTNYGPLAASGANNWKAADPWRERAQFVVFRDIPVAAGQPVVLEVAPGPGGVAVLNGLQILSRGTSAPRLLVSDKGPALASFTNLLFRQITYDGKLSHNEARFAVTLEAESRTTNEISALLFEGDLAVLSPKLPAGWRLVNQGRQYVLYASEPGAPRLEFELLARVTRAEPWNLLRFTGPPAAIASLVAQSTTTNVEVQLQSGTPLEGTNADPHVARGVLGTDREVALRWQSKTTEATREAVVTVDSKFTARLTPNVIRHTGQFHYEILQARLAQLSFLLPPDLALTKLTGDQVRDWRVTPNPSGQTLTVDFIRPVENTVSLTLVTEQPVPALPGTVEIRLPQPLQVQREAGTLSLETEDVLPRLETSEGLRQVNAASGEFAAFRFNARPASLRLSLARVEPLVLVNSRVSARLEETRLVVHHDFLLNVTRAGLYALDLVPPPGFIVADVKADGLDNWKSADGKVRLSFGERVLGDRKISVELEQSLSATPSEIVIHPIAVAGATRESAFIGAGSVAGLQIKTASLAGAREISVAALPERRDELLAFRSEARDWQITLSAERLRPRVVAEVFNLITIGDGLVGGSATIRFGVVNQGVQQFRVRLPKHWRNIEFTGPNIRRQDQQDDVWTLALQDKVWGAYTLVVTYDNAFDPKKATLDAAGAHPLDVEHETGTTAITSAGNLTIEPAKPTEPLRPIDPSELAASDRALVSRPVLLAYRYEGTNYNLGLTLTRHAELAVLDAVADRAQLTSVLTSSGEMLTQASFMVKNNDRQFQEFKLPRGATLWGVAVNGEPAKADRDGDWVLVSLPRGEDRDRVFAVDLKYALQLGALGKWVPRTVRLVAPETRIPGTYVQWELYLPPDRRAAGFGGNMTPSQETNNDWRDAWLRFLNFYKGIWHSYGEQLVVFGGLAAFVLCLVIYGRRRGFGGIAGVAVVFAILAILAGMMLPSLSKAKARAQRIKSVNNLKNIGLAVKIFSGDNGDKLPDNLEQLKDELGTDKLLVDPETGERYTYVGNGRHSSEPDAVIAFSSNKSGHREVLLADGSVQQVNEARFSELMARSSQGGRPSGAAGGMDALMSRRYGLAAQPQVANLPPPAAMNAPATPQSTAAPVAQPVPVQPPMLNNNALAVTTPTAVPTASGIKSLRIEIPKVGRAQPFTRVLSLGGEPPTITFSLMSQRVFLVAQTAFQVSAFLVGLLLMWIHWKSHSTRITWLAVGLALTLAGLASFFTAWRVLHLVLIISVPALLVLLLGWLSWMVWRRRGARGGSSQELTAAATLAFLLGTGLSAQAQETPGATNRVSVVGLVLNGTAHERSAQFDASLELVSAGTNQSVALFSKDIAVQAFESATGDARLWREGDHVGVLLPQRGPASIKMKLLVRLGGDASRRQLEFGLPSALGTRLLLQLDEADAEVDFPTAVSFQRRGQGQSTVVEAVLGAVDRLALSWTPRRKRSAEGAATVFAHQTALVTIGNGAVATRSQMEWQLSQGEISQVRVALPEGHRLQRVTGEAVRSWDYADTNRTILQVDFIKPMAPAARLVLETERPLETLPVRVPVALPRALDVKRETGVLAVRSSEELGLAAGPSTGLDRIDNAEFARAAGDDKLAVFSAWRFLRPDFALSMQAELLQPKLELHLRQQFIVDAEQVSLRAHADYQITRAGVFALRLELPASGRIEAVTCEPMQTWAEREENGRRFLEITLKQRTLGALAADVQFVTTWTNRTATLTLTGLHAADVEKLTGFLVVSAEAGVGIKTSSLGGATEIAAAHVPGLPANTTGVLAYKYLATTPQPAAPWKLTLATETLPPWVRAEIASFYTVSENLVSGRATVRYEIQNAPVKEFRLKVPADWRNVEITGAGVRRRDETNGEWRVELQAKVRGDYRLNVQWEQPRAGTNSIALAGLETVDIERETGAFALFAQGQLQLVPGTASDQLLRIDARELPEWARHRPAGAPALSYRHLRAGWKLPMEVRRFEDAAVLQALAESVRLRTVVADDGQCMTQIQINLRNNGRQSLALVLPSGCTVWSAFVDGQPVRPAQENNRLLLPLERTTTEDTATPVEVTYVGSVRFPRTAGKVELVSPTLDVPLKDARWELFLPPDYTYDRFQGTMSYESAELVPVQQEFTFAEYQRQEISQQQAFESQAMDFLNKAKNDLASGNYESAGKLGQYKQQARGLSRSSAGQELAAVEEKMKEVQSSNLINANRAFAEENERRLNNDQPLADSKKTAALAYDKKVAEQQVAQLQKAQAVAVTRATPLRVNLPTRGIRHAFVQVLQTEGNKPLTVRFAAANDRQASWLVRASRWLGLALGLWLLAALAVLLRPKPAAHPAQA